MRTPILIAAGLLTAVSACSRPAPDDQAGLEDAPAVNPDLALSTPSNEVPVASDVEVHREAPPAATAPQVRTPEPASEPMPEPVGVALNAMPEVVAEPAGHGTGHVHPKAAEPEETVSAPAPGGGKGNTGVTEGLGPVPDRGWGGMGGGGIIDDANPLPGITGRGGAVIIRGGAGGVDDDCAVHRPTTGTSGVGAGTLVNDRDPRRGALINERAPRTSGGGAFPRGGGMVRGGIR